MKSVVQRVAKSSEHDLRDVYSSTSLSSRPIYSAQWTTKPEICQRCYRLRRSVQHLKLINSSNFLLSQLTNFRHQWVQSFAFSTSQRVAEIRNHNYESDIARKNLPSREEGRRSQTSKRFTHLMDHLQSNIFIAGQRLNDLTGYSGIEALKNDIEQQGQFQGNYSVFNAEVW